MSINLRGPQGGTWWVWFWSLWTWLLSSDAIIYNSIQYRQIMEGLNAMTAMTPCSASCTLLITPQLWRTGTGQYAHVQLCAQCIARELEKNINNKMTKLPWKPCRVISLQWNIPQCLCVQGIPIQQKAVGDVYKLHWPKTHRTVHFPDATRWRCQLMSKLLRVIPTVKQRENTPKKLKPFMAKFGVRAKGTASVLAKTPSGSS